MSYLMQLITEGNITLNIYNIPINFGLFKDLEKPFVIEPPDPPSYNECLYKPTYSSNTSSTDACKLSHLVLTAFLLSSQHFYVCCQAMYPYYCILCAVFR